jgi:mRNA interferase RelE/StbE
LQSHRNLKTILDERMERIEIVKKYLKPEMLKSYIPLIQKHIYEITEVIYMQARNELDPDEALVLAETDLHSIDNFLNKLWEFIPRKESTTESTIIQFDDRFERSLRNHHQALKEVQEKVVDKIIKNPSIGKRKESIPNNYRFLHFSSSGAVYVLAYEIKDESIILLYASPHENFYRDFKKTFGII